MTRKNDKGRKAYPKSFSKYHIARILGIKPSRLTSDGGYVRTRESYENENV